MPSSGATGPVTREGTVVLELAEVIATEHTLRLFRDVLQTP
jgi:trimethylamine:corrinoid methyltransferase-like protein